MRTTSRDGRSRRSSPIRTVRPRLPSRPFVTAASRWSISPRTSASTSTATSAGTRRTPPPSCSATPSTASPRRIGSAELVAAPGCYPTAALLALWPLRGHIRDLVVDAKSGVSGAGREATETTHFVSVTENVQAYKVDGHRHAAELEQELNGATFTFVPHLIPVEQGLLASCYVSADIGEDEVLRLYREAYADEPFIDLVDEPPGTDDVRETNRCRIQVSVVGGRVIALAAIDNLWKGAAGQAVQDLNLMLGLAETEGLE